MDFILSRQSIRKYRKDVPIPREDIFDLLKAAMQAPSAGNEQAWQFIVIEDKKVLNELEKTQPYAPFLKDVNSAILVCGDLKLEQFKNFWSIDCSAATENILLAAHSKGIGAIWLGIYPMMERVEPTKKICKLPDHCIPISLIPLGYPDEKPVQQLRFDTDRIHLNFFNNKIN
ncbi:MAG: NADH dehydrogenase [Spirochaetes bacterium GWD1_27_9]|nr:MAG: NADH dehydrogenase [Spirochaetes bacterium GWB1_27_13]OHD23161.1 MAG: NADH dehydrogenase [Spirochaetes bacterium GWC1_27_15]OHD35873.1 MAG: NADH dehydrogenase [Spirochaetes bacterium GWD1_27_9]